jgi:hypothetical protein
MLRGRRLPVSEYQALLEHRIQHLVRIDQPLCLISQVQRSGGSLLSQLLDGHPALHAHPSELRIGYPRAKTDWPSAELLLGAPTTAFRRLYDEKTTSAFFAEGYAKPGAADRDPLRHPFLLPPRLQRALFLHAVESGPRRSPRHTLDAWFTSYFNAWLDNHNLYTGPKRWIAAFAAGLIADSAALQGFLRDYPDGRLISIVREPVSWYASMRPHAAAFYPPGLRRVFTDGGAAAERWLASTLAALDAREAHGDRVLILRFERLITDVESSVAAVGRWLDIPRDPLDASPTFNLRGVASDSSFAGGKGPPVSTAPTDRTALVSDTDRDTIRRLTDAVYHRAAEAVDADSP